MSKKKGASPNLTKRELGQILSVLEKSLVIFDHWNAGSGEMSGQYQFRYRRQRESYLVAIDKIKTKLEEK